MKRKLALIISMVIMSSLCGCYPTGENKINNNISNYIEATEKQDSIPSETLNSSEETSGKIDLELKNVKVSLELPDYTEGFVNKISAKMKEWSDDDLKKIFFPNDQELAYNEYNVSFENVKCHSYETNDERFLMYEPGCISYYDSKKRRDYSYTLISSSIFSIDMQETFSYVEFDDFSIMQAKDTVESYFNKLKIDNLSDPIVYSITSDDANKFFDSFGAITDKHGNPLEKWKEQQQCYILLYPLEYNGVEFSTTMENYILAIITKDDLIELSCRYLIDESTVESENINFEYNAEKALNTIINKYEKLIIDSPIYINSCKLSYIKSTGIINVFQSYKPVWEISLKSEYDDIGTRITYNYIDVESGEII